jgi:DNA invertase Pin-like site-specific DNA recombinase
VDTFVDNDVSAYSGRRRPEYERMLEAVQARRIDAIVCWHVDRLTRRPAELEGLIDLCNAHNVALATVTGDIDLATPMGRMIARTVGNFARYESEHKSERQRRKSLELAQAGKVSGGGTRPFGYEADRVTIRESEAVIIRDMADWVLAGGTINGLCTHLTREGIATVTGSRWKPQVVRALLLSPRIAGLRQHQDVVVGDAEWPGIIDRTTHERLVAVLTDPGRKERVQRAPRRYLLSGMAYCSLCGEKLIARPNSHGARAYVCSTGPAFTGCGKIRRIAEPTEELVTVQALARIANPDELAAISAMAAPGAGDEDAAAEITAVNGRLEELGRDYADGLLGRVEFLAARNRLQERLDDARATLRPAAAALPPGLDVTKLAAWWEQADLAARRNLLSVLIDKVVIHPAVKGRNIFDPTKIEVVWR